MQQTERPRSGSWEAVRINADRPGAGTDASTGNRMRQSRREKRWGRASQWGVLVAAWLFSSLAVALPSIDEETRDLVVEAVESAFVLDLFNARCRNDRSGRYTENLNKELASNFRMTVLDVEDDYFPEGYYRDAEARMERDFIEVLRGLGGCIGAKELRLRDQLKEAHREIMEQLERQR